MLYNYNDDNDDDKIIFKLHANVNLSFKKILLFNFNCLNNIYDDSLLFTCIVLHFNK
jgi:hypothetical protein